MYVSGNMRVTIVAEEKQYYSECASVALFIQHTNCKRRITLSAVTCPAVHLSKLSHKRHDFRKKKIIEHKMLVLIVPKTLPKSFFILRRTKRVMIKIYIGLRVKYPLFLSDFNKI